MAIFPKTEASISELAMQMLGGLAEHGDLYPSITADAKMALNAAFSTYNGSINAQTEAKAAAKVATTAKMDKQGELEEQMRKVIFLAEHDCMDAPGNLDYLGWGGRKTPVPLAKPGNLSGLTPTYEGPGTLSLAWDKPTDGGAVSSYKVERSDQPEGGGVPGPWTLITTSYDPNITLPNQPRGLEMQYRVIATNAAGDSMPSNIATVVL